MGALGYYLSNRAIFLFTAALCVPTLFALAQIRARDIDPDLARGGISVSGRRAPAESFQAIVRNRPLMIFAGAVLLFQFANAAALPTMAGFLATRSPATATLILSVCIFAPQFVVVAIAAWVGRQAQSWGRRPLLSLCFVSLALRCAVFAITTEPSLVIAVQLLDGLSAATLGVLVPLVLADVMRGTGHFNLAQGAVGAAVGIGASLSTIVAGYIADYFGTSTAFLFLAGIAAAGLILVYALMPETRESTATEIPENPQSSGG
jgi:MFS family permease